MSVFINVFYICIVKRSEIKQHIIETASQLFYRNGYNLTGINEIISTSGVAKATLYNHFKSKEDICVAYLQHKNNSFIKQIEAFCLSKELGKSRVLALFEFLELFFEDQDFNGCWCIKTVAEIPRDNEIILTEIQTQKRDFIRFIEQLIIDNIEDINVQESFMMAKQVYLLYEAAVSESHLHKDAWPINSSKQLCNKII
ncbi:TetR family transcriptional regulator [Nonlabens ulvanivorans]|uniref:TetR family transcriptional regulator n=1 Tax=Nonlabens ulvanivorans TaxID=906888 RepID=A0ABX5E4Q8_NONUL|nr:TetR family transcriptional regulator [Nonlabens ulvanivorans]